MESVATSPADVQSDLAMSGTPSVSVAHAIEIAATTGSG